MNKKTYTSISLPVLLAVTISLIAVTGVAGQGMHTTAYNMGLGGGGGAYINGYHANFINPANLMLADRDTRYSVGLLGGLSTSAGGGLVNISLYNEHFTTGQVITVDKAMQISDDWFGSGTGSKRYMGLNVNVVPVGFSYRRDDMAFSTAFRVRTISTTGVNKGMFELALTGLSAQIFNDFKSVDLTTELLAVGEWSFGYAMEVWSSHEVFGPGSQRVFAGVAPKILFGMSYAKIGFESNLQVSGESSGSRVIHDFEYYIQSVGHLTKDLDRYYQERRVQNNSDAYLPDYIDGDSFSDIGSVHGMGLGIDLGGTWEWYMQDISLPVIGSGPQILRASFSITDIGSINFKNNAGDFRARERFDWEGLTVDFEYINEEHGEVSDYFNYVLKDSIGSEIYANFSPGDVSSHRVGLNPMMNIGGSLTLGNMGVMVDIGKGFNNRGINSRRFYTALGTEYNLLKVIPLRFGMRMGGYSGVNLAFGTGVNLKNFEFTIGLMSTPNSGRGGANLSAAWSGLVARF